MGSVFSPNRSLEEPANNDYIGTWNVPMNNNFTAIASCFGALTALALSIETDRATQPDGATKAAELRTLVKKHQALRAGVPPVRAEAPEPRASRAWVSR